MRNTNKISNAHSKNVYSEIQIMPKCAVNCSESKMIEKMCIHNPIKKNAYIVDSKIQRKVTDT
jgi:hypothetical protein